MLAMGFIERLRQARAAREGQAAIEEEVRQRLEKVEEISKAKEKIRLSMLRSQAMAYHMESGIPDLLKELSNLTTARVVGDAYGYSNSKEQLYNGIIHLNLYNTRSYGDVMLQKTTPESFICEVVFNVGTERRKDREYVTMNVFNIEAFPDGTIAFHAERRGSSTIKQERWRNDKTVLEAALERAYSYPKKISEERYGHPPVGSHGR